MKNIMKHLLIALLALALTATMASCGDKKTDKGESTGAVTTSAPTTEPATTQAPSTEAPTTETPTDTSEPTDTAEVTTPQRAVAQAVIYAPDFFAPTVAANAAAEILYPAADSEGRL